MLFRSFSIAFKGLDEYVDGDLNRFIHFWYFSIDLPTNQNGMTRVRGFTQDDAHIFCTEEQVAKEVEGCLEMVRLVLDTLGINEFRVRVGLRDPTSDKYVGAKELWDKAEKAVKEAAKKLGVKTSEEPGEAAFYGPKIDFVVKDVIGREWQLGTVQVEFELASQSVSELEFVLVSGSGSVLAC